MTAKSQNLALDVAALKDLSVTAARGRIVAADAIYDAFARAAQVDDQKILLAKMCAEEIAALEDLGALGRAIAMRRSGGILHNYLSYAPKDIREFYSRATSGDVVTLLDLPAPPDLRRQLSAADRKALTKSIAGLEPVFRDASHDYLALNGKLLNTYNKIKHGFAVVQRIDLLVDPSTIHADWQQQVHVLTGVRADGRINFTSIERSAPMLDSLRKVVIMCSLAWRECSALIVWLVEHDVALF